MKRIFIMLAVLATALATQAQKEANYWYFGQHAGVSFGLGVPTPLTNGALSTGEGCSSISTSAGNLLFYTDGRFVYNKNHQQMPNGFGLHGHSSSTQSGIIVPKPESDNDYYIFTVDAMDDNLAEGLQWSSVDMTAAGGLGDVVNKNNMLVPYTCEKVTAVGNYNGTGFWVITHLFYSDAFYAYLVTSSGVNETPVISNAGSVITGDLEYSKGYIKVSPDGTHLGIAHNTLQLVEIFDFNTQTGVVSNAISDNSYVTPPGFDPGGPYGVEFSPNSQYLYISVWKEGRKIYQYDMEAGTPQNILDSKTLVASVGQGDSPLGAMQIAPDNRIYIARNNATYLSRINSPNTYGIGCNFESDATGLAGRQCRYGLPPFIQSFFFANVEYYYDVPICDGTPAHFYTTASDPPDSVRWDFGDPASGPFNTSTLLNPTHMFTTPSSFPGYYLVTLTYWYSGQSEDVFHLVVVREMPVIDLGEDVTVCAATPYEIDAGEGYDNYLWSTGDTTQTIVTDTSGTYWCEVSYENSCTAIDSIEVVVLPAYEYTTDTSICEGESYYAGGEWQTTAGTYYDSLVTSLGCDSVYITNLVVKDTFNVNLYPQICDGDSIFLQGAWRKTSGTYTDNYITILGCDSIVLNHLDVTDVLTKNVDMTICQGESAYLQGAYQTVPGVYYDTIVNPGSCDSIITTALSVADTFNITQEMGVCEGDSVFLEGAWQTQPGIYYDQLQSVWGCDSNVVTTLSVSDVAETFMEASICQGDSIFLGGSYQKNAGDYMDYYSTTSGCDSLVTTTLTVNETYLVEKDTTICEGESAFLGGDYQDKPGTYYDYFSSVKGCDSVISTLLYVDLLPDVFLGNDTVMQEGTSLVLDATNPNSTYLWQDGSDQSTYLVTEEGIYQVIVTNQCGAETDSIYIRYGNFYCDPLVPNAFTPNQDGLNDMFKPVIDCEYEAYKLSVFNRWGEMVFYSTDINKGWDGTVNGQPANPGVYVWLISYVNGLYDRLENKTFTGNILLIR